MEYKYKDYKEYKKNEREDFQRCDKRCARIYKLDIESYLMCNDIIPKR